MNDFWNDRYGKDQYFYGTEANLFLKEVSNNFPKNSKILCLAEGEGRNAVYLASLGHLVTGVDFSEEGKRKALLLAGKKNLSIEYDVADLRDYDFGVEKWDGVVSIFCHLPSDLRSEVYKKVQKGLKPDGIFVIQSYTPEQLQYNTGGPKDKDFLCDPEIVKAGFEGFSWPRLEVSLTEIHEGLGHNGLSSVLSGVGRKK